MNLDGKFNNWYLIDLYSIKSSVDGSLFVPMSVKIYLNKCQEKLTLNVEVWHILSFCFFKLLAYCQITVRQSIFMPDIT